MPKVKVYSQIGEEVGRISKQTALRSAIPEGLPLLATGTDKACEALGLSVLGEGNILVILGTIFMRGNPFFTQERPGLNEKIFKMIKFRTMDNRKDKDGKLLPDEKRLTKFGKFLRKTSLDEYWYYADPAAEIFDYDPATRTYTTKQYTGYYAAILIKKAFKSAADNFMDEVRITLNETLDRVESIEYDMVWRFSDGWSTSATGRLDFTYDIDTTALRNALKEMGPYQVPTTWSDSAGGFEIEREFNDYAVGAKDRHGEQFVIDMVPYLYDEKGDSGWVGVQFTVANAGAGELWMVNDNGFTNKNYITDLIQLFRDHPDYEEVRALYSDGVSFKNGDMIVTLFPKTNEGPWFTNTNRTPRW